MIDVVLMVVVLAVLLIALGVDLAALATFAAWLLRSRR
jgi:hypothetical protein